MRYKVSYIMNHRKKEFFKEFKTSKQRIEYINDKISNGALMFKCVKNQQKTPIEGRQDVDLAKEILSKKRKVVTAIAIYALIDKDKIVYIGQSSDIMNRLSCHISSNKVFDHYAIVEWLDVTSQRLIDQREADYIKRLKPKYNYVHNRG